MPDSIRLITSTSELAIFCQTAAESQFVTIDTEFIREKTYYPQLCLIQAACEKEAVLIDPLAEGMDLSSLFALLANETVLKVFHAARQDIEIFYYLTGQTPKPLMDTQVAAMVCGYGESISYDALVRDVVKVDLDKGARFTNWEHRPLTQKQIEYALADVVHLRKVHEVLSARIQKKKRESWIADEIAFLCDASTYASHPEDAWERLKIRSRAPKFLSVLQSVAEWREQVSQKMDVPRGRILKDDALSDIAASAPKTIEDLHRLRGMNKGLSKDLQQELLEAVANAKGKAPKKSEEPYNAIPLPPTAGAAIELLRVLLKRQCDKEGVAQKLVAGRNDLEQIAIGNLQESTCASGWRWEVFGQYAANLMDGKLALTFDAETKAVVLLSHEEITGN